VWELGGRELLQESVAVWDLFKAVQRADGERTAVRDFYPHPTKKGVVVVRNRK